MYMKTGLKVNKGYTKENIILLYYIHAGAWVCNKFFEKKNQIWEDQGSPPPGRPGRLPWLPWLPWLQTVLFNSSAQW